MSEAGRTFLLQALDLLASYLFGRTVELEATPVGVADEKRDDETSRFLRELECRHAIACGVRLKEIMNAVERAASGTSAVRRTESRGVIRGRLDIPQYIARRAAHKTLPRTYPVLVNEEIPDTPENVLARQVLRGLSSQLGQSPFPRSYAEGRLGLALYAWARSRLQRLPWSEIRRVAPIQLLQREAIQRIRKRQTGNDAAYAALVEWSREWQVDVSKIGSTGKQRVLDGLLAFPPGDFFWEKVFEVWCLREAVESLQRCGFSIALGPEPLHRRGSGPIYSLTDGEQVIKVWFQRQRPLGAGLWRYAVSGNLLRGIPDIVITGENKVPLLIDAKFRKANSESRPEETYKMLGYAENFRATYGGKGFHGLLAFIGDTSAETVLHGPGDGRLSLIFVQEGTRDNAFQGYFDNSMRAWLANG